jgi:hypothetical protein
MNMVPDVGGAKFWQKVAGEKKSKIFFWGGGGLIPQHAPLIGKPVHERFCVLTDLSTEFDF